MKKTSQNSFFTKEMNVPVGNLLKENPTYRDLPVKVLQVKCVDYENQKFLFELEYTDKKL